MRPPRSTIAALALMLALVTAAPAPAAADHDDACDGLVLPPHGTGDGRTHEVVVGAVPHEFQPNCVAVHSGDTVAWTNVGIVPHDPADLAHGGQCFRVAFDTLDAHGESQPLNPGERYEATFTWDGGETLTVETSLNGEPLKSDTCDVTLLSDGAGSDGDLLEIPYICHRHHTTASGTLVLHAG